MSQPRARYTDKPIPARGSHAEHRRWPLRELLRTCDLCAARAIAWLQAGNELERHAAARAIAYNGISGFDSFLRGQGIEPVGADGRRLPNVPAANPRARLTERPEVPTSERSAAESLFGARRVGKPLDTHIEEQASPTQRGHLHDWKRGQCEPCSICGKPASDFSQHRAECPRCALKSATA